MATVEQIKNKIEAKKTKIAKLGEQIKGERTALADLKGQLAAAKAPAAKTAVKTVSKKSKKVAKKK